MKMKYLATLTFLFFFLPNTVDAGSLYGLFGIGERQYAVSARSLGMGGVNLALFDEFTLSRWNPAQWSNISPVRVNFRSLTSYNSVNDGASSTFTDFNGFIMGIPIGNKFTIGGGINPISNSNYALSQSDIVNGEPWNLTINGNGGISSFGLGVAFQITESFSIGIKNDWVFGKKDEEWITRFDNVNFLSTTYMKSNSFDGALFTIGLFKNLNNFNYAGSITFPLNFRMTREISEQTLEPKIFLEKEIDYPTELRMGFTYDLDERYVLGMDYQISDWSSLESDFNGKFGAAYDIFGGIEKKISPRRNNLLGKLAFRSGFTFRRLYTGGLEESLITERALTFGIGIPAHNGKEIIDLGFSYGLRGSEKSTAVEETTFLFMIGFSAGEKWFVRRGR